MMRINTSFPFYYNNNLVLVTFFFLLLLLHFSSRQVCPTSNGLSGDSQLLISFQNSLPPTAQTPSWDPSISPCDFNGVSCKNSRVSSIDLSNYNLGTNFPKVATFLLSLDNLHSLLLKSANISGAISSSPKFYCTSSLISLDLSENAIPGPISDISLLRACSGLASLNLSRNSIGPSTKEDVRKGIGVLQGLPSLNVLDVSYNSISGDNVVPWIMSSSFPELNHLSLKGNRLTGNLPEFTFKNLGYLDLSLNNFSAELPLFTDCSNLQHLDLSSNSFSGDVGLSLSTCPNLAFLNLSRNSFTGGVPALPSSGGMQFLYLQENHFSGVLPPNLPDWCTALVELNLSSNNFTGTVPETLAACSALELLDISNNNFSGELPVDTVLLELVHLKTLVMSFNNFIGGLSDSFSKMVNLGVLDVSSNNISGAIPDGLCQGSRSSLRVLYLQNNLFGGTIPDSLSNCSKLESLDLSFNYLTGTIPPRLGFLPNLRDVVMWLNELHGEIPQEFMHLQSLESLILDFNYLTGSIPDGLSNCSKLNWISLSSNGLSGEIPPSFGRLANLEILKLGNNSLSGGIPAELGDCQSLLWLDLNTNLLSRTIPPALFKQSGNTTASVTGQRYVDIKNDGRQQCQGAGNLLEFEGIRWAQLDRVLTRYPCKLDRVYRGIIQPPFSHNGSMLFLDLSYNKLNGVVPKELGSMYYLIVLNLGHNDLSGPIPKELGELRSVAILDLSYNRLNGTIPEALTGLSFGDIDLSNNNLSGKIPESNPFDTISPYRFVNNSGLCGYPLGDCPAFNPLNSHQGKPNSNQAYLAGSVAIGLLLSLLCAFGLIFFTVETRKRRKKQEAVFEAYMENHSNSTTAHSVWKIGTREALSISITTFDQRPLKKLTFADLLEATNGFHNDCLVGSGGFGDVYKAQLKDGSVVAIKKLIHISGQGDREFTAEMETIGRIRHRNLVPLLGYCKVGEERLLVYEYMRYGSLEDVLRDRKKIGIRLNWPVRRSIAVGAAKGLSFLHQTCNPCIIHRDMKSSNVLLDENLEARVSDFGMARYMNTTETHLSVSVLAGTPGYVPPEYYQSFRCSTRGDVYSYGVVLLELLTGKQPTDSLDFGDNNLVGWVKQHRKMKISDVFDPTLMKEGPSTEIELLQHLEVAVACLNEQPERRPTMFKVLAKLMQIQASSGMDSCSSVGGIEMSIKEGNELNSSHL